MSKRARVLIIAGCLVVAAFFLFFRLGKGDPVTDEVELAFRSIGYMDFLATPFQTTPLEWFSDAPWWTRLTFHDHPPVIFALGYAVFQMFGDSLLALRSVFAILGLASLWLVYQISKKVLGESVSLIALAIASVNTYLTWIGRIGLQEELVIFFTLLSIWFLIKAEQNRLYFIFWGAGLGLGLLSKYTAGLILPISILYLWYFNRAGLKQKYFYIAIGLTILMFSPVLIYNIEMYRTVGHFDLQVSSFLGQDVSAHWQSLPGKEIGSLGERLASFYPNLWQNDRPLALGLVPSLLILFYLYARGRLEKGEKFIFWTIVLYHLLIVVIGPSQRFLVMLAPWAVIAIAYVLYLIFKKRVRVFAALAVVFLVYQGAYNFQTNLAYGEGSSWLGSTLHNESAAYGYNELEKYLRELLDTKKPSVKLELLSQHRFIESVRDSDFRKIKNNPGAATLIIYDPRVDQVAKLWLYDRRYYYDGWPFVSADEFLQVQQVAPQYFSDLGISDLYYIATTPETFAGGYMPQSGAEEFEQNTFVNQRIKAEKEIPDRAGQIVFRIYHFGL